MLEKLTVAAGCDVRSYFLDEVHFEKKEFPWNVNPLAFLKYDESEIYRSIAELGWRIRKTRMQIRQIVC